MSRRICLEVCGRPSRLIGPWCRQRRHVSTRASLEMPVRRALLEPAVVKAARLRAPNYVVWVFACKAWIRGDAEVNSSALRVAGALMVRTPLSATSDD